MKRFSATKTTLLALSILLEGTGCSLLFNESQGDGGAALDADASIDAMQASCEPHECDEMTTMLFGFDGLQPLANECDVNSLQPDAVNQIVNSYEGLGNAIGISAQTKFAADTTNLTASWTLDFWLRQGNTNGDLLSLIESTLADNQDCGIKLVLLDNVLKANWTINGATMEVLQSNIDMQRWSHVVVTYMQGSSDANISLSVDSQLADSMLVTACDKTTTTLTLGNFSEPTDGAAAQAAIDEIRVQNDAVAAAPCVLP